MAERTILTLRDARRFLAGVDETEIATPCEYGHLDCSNVPGGACGNEVWLRFPELEDD